MVENNYLMEILKNIQDEIKLIKNELSLLREELHNIKINDLKKMNKEEMLPIVEDLSSKVSNKEFEDYKKKIKYLLIVLFVYCTYIAVETNTFNLVFKELKRL